MKHKFQFKVLPCQSNCHDSVLVEEVEGHVADLSAGNDNLGARVCDGFDLLLLQNKIFPS
jgi:hypothetical protein